MRILFVSFVGNNRWSGMGKWTHSIAEECEKRGHSVTLWFEDDFPRLRKIGRMSALAFPVYLAYKLFSVRRRFDFVVVHEPSGFWYAQLRRIFRSLPPVVAMSHGVESRRFEVLREAERHGYAVVPRGTRIKTPLLRLWQSNGTLRGADQVICLSSYDRDYLVSRLGVAPWRIHLMINGVEEENFLQPRRISGGKRVLFVAGWLDAKGSFTLPLIWKRISETDPDATLTLVGTGASADSVLQDFAPELRASIEVIPRLTGLPQMLEQLAAHDVFLMPSLNEGSPLALLEAMAAGIPVVAGRAGGIPDIVTHEREGLLFDPLDPKAGAASLSRLLGDRDLRERVAAAGVRRARELTWASATDTLLAATGAMAGEKAIPADSGAAPGTAA